MNTQCNCRQNTGSSMSRREFVKLTGLTTAALAFKNTSLIAGPFEDKNDYLRVIPQDKRLHPAWVKSLFERGTKDTVTHPEALGHIGMPVGGLFAGTVYLSGDGRLWLWDVFNRDQEGINPRPVEYKGKNIVMRDGANYVEPSPITSPFELSFALEIAGKSLPLTTEGFSSITFDGRYPLARIRYQQTGCPVKAELEAFSPFIPLNLEDSSLPAVMLNYTLTNTSDQSVTLTLTGRLQNPVCHRNADKTAGLLKNQIRRRSNLVSLDCSASPLPSEASSRPDILFEDFEKPDWQGWQVTGDAFGPGPVKMTDIPDYQGDVKGQGARVVNSHASAPGQSVAEKDAKTGTLTSRPFTIERHFINCLIGGGNHAGQTCLEVFVDNTVVASTTGRAGNQMTPVQMNLCPHEGKQAVIRIVDQATSGWGNIGVDQIVFTDQPLAESKLEMLPDFGTMTLSIFNPDDNTATVASINAAAPQKDSAEVPLGQKLIGTLSRTITLAPGRSQSVPFVICWHFPNLYGRGVGDRWVGHEYAARFDSALAVSHYIADNLTRLTETTRLWVKTWYDSTLPYWLLDRTMANTSTLATTTCYRFKDGRFWAWEGIGCCEGTCTHVWHYAQAPARLFPAMERDMRQRVDLGIAQHDDGSIGMRAGLDKANEAADDGQCGRILGAYREHQMSANDVFLRKNWPNIKRAIQYLIAKDGNDDGIIEGDQPNTLDASWFGKISFLASLYLAALRAGQAMAAEIGDTAFSTHCKTIADKGAQSILELFNGEYFIQIEDPNRKTAVAVRDGCYIDQIVGQTWAHWVGLGHLFDPDKQKTALQSLWRYNFVPDVGPFRAAFTRGRWYATAGDAGLLMCTWPRSGRPENWEQHWQYMYFNECMSGFEYQAAAHMIYEGLLTEGLAIARAIHDRYNAALRNPYNEIECSDHYARAMAGFGIFQAVCGLDYHGPLGRLGIDPKLSPEQFAAPFTAAQGWGTLRQTADAQFQTQRIELHYGSLKLNEFTCRMVNNAVPRTITASLVSQQGPSRTLAVQWTQQGQKVRIRFDKPLHIQQHQTVIIETKTGVGNES
ncbi:MAG TPA: GH116 family glycosyl hydrolase [Anaerohalosphaeraceae bacterium]|nr:GH116 family glycosyl hydrolase [Anaerohalosphaeraceae bacterium]